MLTGQFTTNEGRLDLPLIRVAAAELVERGLGRRGRILLLEMTHILLPKFLDHSDAVIGEQ